MPAVTPEAVTRPFLALTAADLMSTPVRTIPQDTPLREAARLLARANISGAPVVDAQGRCLGVLSSSDFVTWASKEGEVTHFIAPWGEMIDVDDAPDNEIRHYMTAQPVTVAPGAPIGDLARMMVAAHIHRVLVVVEQNRPRGIVTSTDILAAVARAAQSAAQESAGQPPQRSRTRR
jgi:CBS domain-containing membrane protein